MYTINSIKVVHSQSGVNFAPFGVLHVFWMKVRIADNVQKFFKILTRLLNTVIPVPVS